MMNREVMEVVLQSQFSGTLSRALVEFNDQGEPERVFHFSYMLPNAKSVHSTGVLVKERKIFDCRYENEDRLFVARYMDQGSQVYNTRALREEFGEDLPITM